MPIPGLRLITIVLLVCSAFPLPAPAAPPPQARASDFAGVITTPGVACLVRQRGYQAGVVISASHNPWRDNGIKSVQTNCTSTTISCFRRRHLTQQQPCHAVGERIGLAGARGAEDDQTHQRRNPS